MQRLPGQQGDFFYIPLALKAPLATFDTIDLGDEDVQLVKTSCPCPRPTFPTSCQEALAPAPTLATNIGGTHTKGRGPAGKLGTAPPCQDQAEDDHVSKGTEGQPSAQDQPVEDKDGTLTPTRQSPQNHPTAANDDDDDDIETPTQSPTHALDIVQLPCSEIVEQEKVTECSSAPSGKQPEVGECEAKPVSLPPGIGKLQGTWVKHQDSDSSSSSESGSDGFNFRPIQGSASASATQDDDDDDDTDYTPQTRRRLILRERNDYSLNLYPEDIDPAQIASPSKKKAYQKRLQRLQVKTSPIVRPRSTTPINVVTLGEYVLNSPEKSPASPLQEKLKICLPSSEFISKPKSPRHLRKPVSAPDNSYFVFNEEILFSHTRSALVVDEVGQVPPSPRRVLIPPTLSPSTSPKLSRAAGPNSADSLQLVYFKGEKEDDIFGQRAEPQPEDNWATFPELDQAAETQGKKKVSGEGQLVDLSLDSEEISAADEYLTVSISPSEAAIEVILSAASSSNPSPSTPDSDQAIKTAVSSCPVISPQERAEAKPNEVKPEPSPQPPPIPPRRRPPPPPPPQPAPPPDVVPGDEGCDPVTARCDLLVDIDSQ